MVCSCMPLDLKTKSLKWVTSVTNGELMVVLWTCAFWVLFLYHMLLQYVSIEAEFWQQVSHIVRPPASLYCSQKLTDAAKPLVPPSAHLLHPTLGPCSCPMTSYPLLLFRPATPLAACIPHSQCVRESEARSRTALPSTTLSLTYLMQHAYSGETRSLQDHFMLTLVLFVCSVQI